MQTLIEQRSGGRISVGGTECFLPGLVGQTVRALGRIWAYRGMWKNMSALGLANLVCGVIWL